MSLERTPEEWARLFKENGLPVPPGPVLDARWVAGRNDWYVRVRSDGRWYWLDAKSKWVHIPQGPL